MSKIRTENRKGEETCKLIGVLKYLIWATMIKNADALFSLPCPRYYFPAVSAKSDILPNLISTAYLCTECPKNVLEEENISSTHESIEFRLWLCKHKCAPIYLKMSPQDINVIKSITRVSILSLKIVLFVMVASAMEINSATSNVYKKISRDF